jgi:hypothetical protein
MRNAVLRFAVSKSSEANKSENSDLCRSVKMREPFYMDRLNGDDRRKVRRLLAQVLVFYLSLVVLLVVGSVVKESLSKGTDVARRQTNTTSP